MKLSREMSKQLTEISKKPHCSRNCLLTSWREWFPSTILKYKIRSHMERFKKFVFSSLAIIYMWILQTSRSDDSVVWLFPLFARVSRKLLYWRYYDNILPSEFLADSDLWWVHRGINGVQRGHDIKLLLSVLM